MRVRVRLFGTLQSLSPAATPGRLELDIPAGASVKELIDRLQTRPGEVAGAAINGKACSLEQRIEEGDEVYLLNMLGGG